MVKNRSDRARSSTASGDTSLFPGATWPLSVQAACTGHREKQASQAFAGQAPSGQDSPETRYPPEAQDGQGELALAYDVVPPPPAAFPRLTRQARVFALSPYCRLV